MDTSTYTWLVLPALVFVARVLDVALGTLRIVFVSQGRKHLAPLLGFVEVLIWISVVAEIVKEAHNFPAYLAYAAGFAAGNFVGLWIEERLALGSVVMRTILAGQPDALVQNLRQAGYGVTAVDGSGANGPVQLIYTIVKRRDISVVTAIIHQTHPHAFLSVENVRSIQEGVFPNRPGNGGRTSIRKGK